MKGKIAFVLGAAVGYVLGTRAGRERYEQIKRGAQHVWHTEPVQRGVTLVKDAVDERTDGLREFVARVGADVFTSFATPKDPRSGSRAADEDVAKADESDAAEPSAPAKSSTSKSSASKSSAAKKSTAKASGSSTKRTPKADS